MKAADRLEALRKQARQQTLVILVWGPGEPSTPKSPLAPFWKKRNQIRDEIAKVYPNSEVLFSESDVLRDHTRDLRDLLVEELAHAAIADCLLVLDVSRGAHVEVDRFTSVPSIAAKITVMLPEAYAGGTGLVSQVHKAVHVQGFSQDELDKCIVATKKAISIVDSAAIQKLAGPSLLPYA